jgi:MFS family permease
MSAEQFDGPPPGPRSPDAAVRLTRHRAFLLYWAARVSAAIALQMQAVAVGWQIYELTNSALDLAWVGLAQFLPAFALVLVAGHFADRYDRRTVAWIAHGVEGLATATLAVATFAGWITPGLILICVFVIGAGRAFEHPSVQTLLPSLVPASVLPRAVAGSSSAVQTATILGPALGGVLYAINPLLVYGVCATLFVAAGVLVALIPFLRAAGQREPFSLNVLFGGLGFIRRHPLVLGACALDMFAVLLGGATALLPMFAKDVFATGPFGLGLMRAAPAFGALSMSMVLMRWPLARHVGRKMYIAVAIFGASTVVFGLSTSFELSLAALVVLGASDNVSVVIRQTLVQLQTPDEMRGRVYAVNSLFVGTSNQLGEFESGLLAHWIGATASVAVGGIGTLLVVLAWTKLFPGLLRVDRFDDATSQPARKEHS